ncbi:HNH endonuclease [Desulfopila sp. IMCC35008]|uniref:HNH endonuclease n=1 Tax=Desulfopila sp. IMCC35008 TaxID=2653858 RepID=UPI0013D09054|nr:HNH endonuclease [Desulfopila sp. IMCC35008]
MCGRLDNYLLSFSKLRVDRNRKSWPKHTNHCSPYKPFLLLSVIDHISSGRITTTFIEPSFELLETFGQYISLLPDFNRPASMSYPFYHLDTSGFWELVPQPGQIHQKSLSISSMKRLREVYLGARISKDLFMLLQMAHSREKLQTVLIDTYFSPQFQKTVHEQSLINQASDTYSFSLMEHPATADLPIPAEHFAREREQIRSQGFRRAVINLYQHRCALCGIKMLTPEGHTVVDAAHIKPWSESKNDNPTNGMALCKLCHWSFDNGLMSVDRQFKVLVSVATKKDPNLPGHILTLSERHMFRPSQSRYWPSQDNFEWHRWERFR